MSRTTLNYGEIFNVKNVLTVINKCDQRWTTIGLLKNYKNNFFFNVFAKFFSR